MEILSATFRNFKGIKELKLDLAGKNASIFGDNATGKTTIADGFSWLLFDKDSQFRSQFEIKTLNEDGSPKHGLEHEVEALFGLGHKTIKLRKAYSEKWTKPRGAAVKVFTGNTTSYFVDDVPVQQKDYKEAVKEIADEEIFRLLSSPDYFSQIMHWQDRRRLLLEICGDISDSEVVGTNKDLLELFESMEGRTMEGHKKMVAARRTLINKDIEKIPTRISEVERGLVDVAGIDVKDEWMSVEMQEVVLEDNADKVAQLNHDAAIVQKQKELAKLETKLINAQNEQTIGTDKELRDLYNEQMKAEAVFLKSLSVLAETIVRKEQIKKDIAKLDKAIIDSKVTWHEVNDVPFVFNGKEVCGECGRPFEEHLLAEARERAEQVFNDKKAERLKKNNEEGRSLVEDRRRLVVNLTATEQLIEALEKDTKNAKAPLDQTGEIIIELTAQRNNTPVSPEIVAINADIEKAKEHIKTLRTQPEAELERLAAFKKDAQEKIKAAKARIALVDSRAKGEARIEELKAEERKLAAELEALERELYLMDQFTRRKVNMLESKINNKFKLARFRLFQEQLNGSLNEVCEVLYNGVPYSAGLNNSARINVGLDIIQTISEHYQKSIPVFIDNRESVTRLTEIDSQVVSLIVSEKDKNLRVKLG